VIGTLNPILIEQQGITSDAVKRLNHLHYIREGMFELAARMDPAIPFDLVMLRRGAVRLELLEFEMQKQWNFDMNRDKHSWWCLMPHCECNPQYTSIFPVRATSTPCKIHGAH
jgi:hypothetical protein